MHLIYRQTCRVCGSSALTSVISLGDQHLQGLFVKPGRESPPARRIPLALVRCDPTKDERACGLLQLSHSTPVGILYSGYWYRSGTNQTMTRHLQGIARDAMDLTRKSAARVLDIGCNDGTLLRHYPADFLRCGIDPSDVARGVDDDLVIVNDFFPSQELQKKVGEKPFDIVTSIAMFYDLEDPIAFTKQIKSALAPDGVWIFEMSYMPTMLAMNSYDTICHEHLEYYSLAVLEFIVGKADMKIFRAEINDINGGSIRCYATHRSNYSYRSPDRDIQLSALRRAEFDLELDTNRPYHDFQARIAAHRDELVSLLTRLKVEGKRIHVYGASTKGNTILQWCGINNAIIDFAADRNPEKDGARTLGTDIPIISEEKSRSMRPDYYLVLPWHFRSEFLERERPMLDSGTAMIFPLPKVEIVRTA